MSNQGSPGQASGAVRWLPAGFRRPVLAGLALLGVLVPRGAGQESEEDSYVVRGRTVIVQVDRARVGVVLDEGRGLQRDLLGALPEDLAHERTAAGGLQLLRPATKTDRNGLLGHARGLLRHKAVEHAGLLVTPAGSDHPMLLTEQLVVRFRPEADEEQIAALRRTHGLREVRRSRFSSGLHLLAVPRDGDTDALEACRALAAEPLVAWCEPDFVRDVQRQSPDLDDPLLPHQWHHQNTGQGDGLIDADIDAPQAWAMASGSEEVVIALLEDGFDSGHPDLTDNLWASPDDPAVHGWDFEDDDATLEGDPSDPAATAHGTAVAGCAGARGGNGLGLSGSCPTCQLMLIRMASPGGGFGDAEALRWAVAHGAWILSNSWTYPPGQPVPEAVREAIDEAVSEGRDGLGCVVFFAVRNEDTDIEALGDVAALPQVIAVGSITNTDERTRACGYGTCLSLLGPSRLNEAPNFTEGTLDVATTDWRGTATGYNDDPALEPHRDVGWPACSDVTGDGDYTLCFGGTSAATPIVAGVAGLILSADASLTQLQVRRLLQDTADKAEDGTGASAAAYDAESGVCTDQRHGYGRVNAAEAVGVVAALDRGGRAGVDLVLRDNRLDWGNTEQPSHLVFDNPRGTLGHWLSEDIKVDAPPFGPVPATSAAFAALPDEAPLPGETQRVFVRLRNRGPRPALEAEVTLLATTAGTALPPLPRPFWARWPVPPERLGPWTHVGRQRVAEVPYSGASVAAGADDAAVIVAFDWTVPAADPVPGPTGWALVALAHAADDPLADRTRALLAPDAFVPRDNNVTAKAVVTAPAAGSSSARTAFFVRNPFARPITTCLELLAPEGVAVELAPLDPLPGEATLLPGPGEASATPAFRPGGPSSNGVFGAPFELPPLAGHGIALTVSAAPAVDGGADASAGETAAGTGSDASGPAAGSGQCELRQWIETPEGWVPLGGLLAAVPGAGGS